MSIIQKPLPLFLLGALITTIYIPGIFGASISTGWFLLLIVAPFCLHRLEPGWGLLFVSYSAISLTWTANFNIAFFFFLQVIALSCIYQLGERINEITIKFVFHGLAFGLGISSLIALLQYFYNYKGVYAIETTNGAVAGLFVNANIYCEISVVILIALIALKLFWWIPVTLPGLILVPSRSALVALGVCSLIYLWSKDKIVTILVFCAICCCVFVFYKNGSSLSVQQRFDLWADTIRGFKIFGNGVGSFEILYPLNAVHIDTSVARPVYAHNDLLQLFFEYGIGTLLLLPLIWKALISDSKYKIIFYAICTTSLFTYSFHVPAIAFIGFLVAGYVSSGNASFCNSRNDRGSTLFKRLKGKKPSTI